ncbi:SH3 domain-binding protein 5-like, partial [Meleagris gallopavo]|uniref:SH3 domain-binding protein 5-like n=1 Tax=Meleagris gallopavo TaxID=9103 RepID=UPI00093A0C2A
SHPNVLGPTQPKFHQPQPQDAPNSTIFNPTPRGATDPTSPSPPPPLTSHHPVPPKEHKSKVTALEHQVAQAKTRYSVALRNLEQISEQIHARRLHRLVLRRASPVGAESGHRGAEGPPPDSVSVLSLQTIASDLQKFDSVEHLLGLSDASSLQGEEMEETTARRGGNGRFRHHRSVSL